MTSEVGVTIAYQFWANNTAGNWTTTGLKTFTTTSEEALPPSGTVVFECLSYDGRIQNSSSNYDDIWNSTTGTVYNGSGYTVNVGQYYYSLGSKYYIFRGFLFFDTSTLPDKARITSVILSINITADYSTTDFLLVIQNGQPEYPHAPLIDSDYWQGHYSGNGGTLNTSLISSTNVYYNITLNSDGISWINKTGLTKLTLRSDRDIDKITPTDKEYIVINHAESGFPAKLYVTYETFYLDKHQINTIFKGEDATFSLKWIDDFYGLSGYIFGCNASGTWQNDTWVSWAGSPSEAWANITKKLPSEANVVVTYQIWVNNTNGEWKTSGEQWIRTVVKVADDLPSTIPNNAIKFSFQRKMIEYQGILWFFYVNSSEKINYVTSDDWGETWSEPTYVTDYDETISIDNFQQYIHYVKAGDTLNYRRGVLYKNGTIIWTTDEQVVLNETGTTYEWAHIGLNNTGFPWIGYVADNGTGTYPYVIKSKLNNGTWQTENGFPYLLDTESHIYWTVGVVSLESIGEMYVIYGHDDIGWKGVEYDNGWGAVEQASTSPIECAQRNDFESYKDNVYITYHILDGGHVLVYRNSSGFWSEEMIFANESIPEYSTPAMSITTLGVVRLSWFDTNSVLWYREFSDGTWSDPKPYVKETFTPETVSTLVLVMCERTAVVGIVYLTQNPTYLKYAFVLAVVTPLYVGWNNFTAWNVDVGHTLEEICANIQGEAGVDARIVIKYNGTEYRYDYGYAANANVKILSTSDELRIYCLSEGEWYHNYQIFAYLRIYGETAKVNSEASAIPEIQCKLQAIFQALESYDALLAVRYELAGLSHVTASAFWNAELYYVMLDETQTLDSTGDYVAVYSLLDENVKPAEFTKHGLEASFSLAVTVFPAESLESAVEAEVLAFESVMAENVSVQTQLLILKAVEADLSELINAYESLTSQVSLQYDFSLMIQLQTDLESIVEAKALAYEFMFSQDIKPSTVIICTPEAIYIFSQATSQTDLLRQKTATLMVIRERPNVESKQKTAVEAILELIEFWETVEPIATIKAWFVEYIAPADPALVLAVFAVIMAITAIALATSPKK